MKFTLLSFVVVSLCAGIVVIAADEGIGSPTSRISRFESDEEQQKPSLFSTEGKFLASLRFWDKNKNKPQPTASVPHSTSAKEVPVSNSPLPHKAETPSEAQNIPTGQTDTSIPHQPHHLATTSSAPEPPPNPYIAHGYGELEDAPLPGQSATLAYGLGEEKAPIPQGIESSTTSYLSYSFDTRDWVEFFPLLQEQDVAQEGVLVATQATSFHSPILNQSSKQSEDNEDDHWNGQATTLVTHIQRDPIQIAVESAQKPNIDLSPSYKNRLTHTQTCGVVVVQANFPLTQIAAILDEINQLQHDLTRYIGVPEPKEKIELCLFKDEDSYLRFLREFFPRAPRDRRALFVKLDNKPGTLMVQKSKDFEIDLRHEMTHALIHASISNVPIWLDEGLAKYFEVPLYDRAGNHPYMSKVRWNVRFGAVPSLARLTKLETIDDMGSKEYQDSWAWTHFLIHRSSETHRLLAAYLQMLAKLPAESNVKLAHSSIPSLKLYLDDIMPNQRDVFKKYFGAGEK